MIDKDLLILLKETYLKDIEENPNKKKEGLCYYAYILLLDKVIDSIDYYILLKYIKSNPPLSFRIKSFFTRKFPIIENDGGFTEIYISVYFWKTSNTKSRIKWLNNHINKLNK